MDLTPLLTGHMEQLPERTIFFQQSGNELAPVKGGLRNDHYRLTLEEGGAGLFDMIQDPSEMHDLTKEMSEKFDSLKLSYDHWYRDIADHYQANTSIPVGYPEFPKVIMPAHESHFSGNIQFKEGHGWAHDWLVNWSALGDSIWWNVEYRSSGSGNLSHFSAIYLSYVRSGQYCNGFYRKPAAEWKGIVIQALK